MKRYHVPFILGVLLSMFSLCMACSDDKEDESEYSDWKNRNEIYFDQIRAIAKDSINQVRRIYGSTWREHSPWRTFLSYSLDSTAMNTSMDSIYVRILKTGTGTTSPIGRDSCRIFFRGRLMPTSEHPDGYVFTHSGQSSIFEEIFDHKISTPTLRRPTSFVRGFSTALMNMHVGDLWRVYIPYPLGYNKSENATIPAYSTLIFEIELLEFYPRGTKVPSWN